MKSGSGKPSVVDVSSKLSPQGQLCASSFISQSKNMQNTWGDDYNQMYFARACYDSCQRASASFGDKAPTVKGLYDFHATTRRDIALHLDQEKEIGLYREPDNLGKTMGYQTTITSSGRYADYFSVLTERIRKGKEGPVGVYLDNGYSIIDETDVEILSKMAMFKHLAGTGNILTIAHPDFLVFEKEVSSLKLDNALERIWSFNKDGAQEPNKEFFQQLAEIVWFLDNTMPLQRGSAATCDMFIKSIFEHNGYDYGIYESDLSRDIDAMSSSKEEFMERFEDHFKQKPKIRDSSDNKIKGHHTKAALESPSPKSKG